MAHTPHPGLPHAVRAWTVQDPTLARLARAAPPRLVPRPAGGAFASLTVSLLHQQVSLAAGRTITKRLMEACGGTLSPDAVLALGDERMRAAGVSRQKRGYIQDLARHARSGEFDGRRLARASDEEVIEALTSVRGIGTWTAKMFLLFHLRRPDVVAPEDLGLQAAARLAYKIPASRARAFLETRSERWRPYRSLACLTLWSWRDGRKAP